MRRDAARAVVWLLALIMRVSAQLQGRPLHDNFYIAVELSQVYLIRCAIGVSFCPWKFAWYPSHKFNLQKDCEMYYFSKLTYLL